MVNVKIDEDTLLEMLMNRVEDWTQDEDVVKLYHDMYDSYVYGGCFDGMELDVNVIVDNDYVNYCTVLEEGDSEYEEILKLYEEQGLGDISCDSCYGFIEAISDDKKLILVRC